MSKPQGPPETWREWSKPPRPDEFLEDGTRREWRWAMDPKTGRRVPKAVDFLSCGHSRNYKLAAPPVKKGGKCPKGCV